MFVSDICIIGAGPAGSTLAARMAELGYRVCLIERAIFPRAHLGESLSPGVMPLLEVIGARGAVEDAGFFRVSSVLVKWDQGTQQRRDPRQEGVLVDRGRFDKLLLDRAKALGVRVFQPARVREQRYDVHGWHLRVETEGIIVDLETAFLADASGRAAALPARRRRTGQRTIALYGYWRGGRLPDQPRIEAGPDAWYWGVPLPDGSYNTLVFVDVDQFRSAPRASLAERFYELIGRSSLMAGCKDARLDGSVQAADATAYVDETCVTSCSIKVGDAGLAIDPLSSSGVQKAIQNALAGAIVVNSLLRRPESSAAAIQFFRDNVDTASDSHRRWAAEHYSRMLRCGGGSFWQNRAWEPASMSPSEESAVSIEERLRSQAVVELSSRLEFVDLPCIEGEFVMMRSALRHPRLDRPLAFLSGWEMAPLLKQLHKGLTPFQVARSWSSHVPIESGLALVGWLIGHGIFVQKGFDIAEEGTRR